MSLMMILKRLYIFSICFLFFSCKNGFSAVGFIVAVSSLSRLSSDGTGDVYMTLDAFSLYILTTCIYPPCVRESKSSDIYWCEQKKSWQQCRGLLEYESEFSVISPQPSRWWRWSCENVNKSFASFSLTRGWTVLRATDALTPTRKSAEAHEGTMST